MKTSDGILILAAAIASIVVIGTFQGDLLSSPDFLVEQANLAAEREAIAKIWIPIPPDHTRNRRSDCGTSDCGWIEDASGFTFRYSIGVGQAAAINRVGRSEYPWSEVQVLYDFIAYAALTSSGGAVATITREGANQYNWSANFYADVATDEQAAEMFQIALSVIPGDPHFRFHPRREP